MKKRLYKVGNSHGLLFTKDMMHHLRITDSVDVVMESGRIVIRNPERPLEVLAAEVIEQFEEAFRNLAK